MKDFSIILPTHSSYKEVVENFLQLFEKNWSDCPFEIIISVTGDKVSFNGYKTMYNGKDATLIDCIVNATKKYKSEYYICFLGDAFINKKINNSEFICQLKVLKKEKIDYCCLNYVKKYMKEKKFNEYFRYINNLDRYSHSFVAFVSSNNFVKNELRKYKSDLDFEIHYLNQRENKYLQNHIIVRKNYLNIVPCITKGKWDKINYLKIKRNNPEIKYATFEIQTWKETIIDHLRIRFVSLFPNKIRVKMRNIIYKVLKRKIIT